MFHGRPLNTSTSSGSSSSTGYPPVQQQQQQSWPLTPQEHNNLRASQNGTPVNILVKFYLPEEEIRRSTIPTNCTLQQVTKQIKGYASVADKDLVLAWNDDQNEWIRFDTDSEFNDAMNHARHLLSVGGVFKIQAKEGKTPKKQETVEPVKQPEPKPIVTQPPVTQPIFTPPITQPPVTQPPVNQPPVNQPPIQPFRPGIQPFGQPPINQPPVMFQPMMVNQPMMAQASNNMPVPRNASPFGNKTLTNSVTMQNPHPLNSSFGSPQPPTTHPVMNQPMTQQMNQPPMTQPVMTQPMSQPVQQPISNNVDINKLNELRNYGFSVDDSVLVKALQDANGDMSIAVDKILSNM